MLRFAFACFGLFCASLLSAQAPVVTAVKVDTPPVVDGTIGDDWKDVPSFEGLLDQTAGTVSPEGGKFWIAYDDKFLYFAARLTDSQPNAIRATEYRTNTEMPGDDTITLALDLSGSLSDFSYFQSNPRGATNLTLAGGRAAKREWTGEIVARGRTTPTGWESEMRIPWSVLPVPAAGKRDLRFNVIRYIPRLNRSYINVFVESGKIANTPIWRGVVLPRPYVDRSLRMLPYAYTGYDADRGIVLNSGMDLKTTLREGVELVGSVNPDFRNIENSILSLDFSRFARIADETRPFFQEGADYLDSALFASQTIRGFDVGLKSYGKLNDKTQFGVLDTIDFGRDNASLVNLTYAPTVNDNYRITVTQRSTGGRDNGAYLARYSKQMGPWSLLVRDMGSQDTVTGWGENSTAHLGFFQNGFTANLSYNRVTPNFNPALGFFPETNYQGPTAYFEYERPLKRGPLQSYDGYFFYSDRRRTTGEPYSKDLSGGGSITTRNGIELSASLDRPVFLGSHDRIDSVSVSYPVSDPYRNGSFSYDWGEIGGQRYKLGSIGAAYRLFGRLQLTLSHQSFELGPDENEQTIFGGNYDLGGDRSISGRLVSSHAGTNYYVALRRSGNRGAEYYLIYGDPNAPTFRQSLILKVVVPFRV